MLHLAEHSILCHVAEMVSRATRLCADWKTQVSRNPTSTPLLLRFSAAYLPHLPHLTHLTHPFLQGTSQPHPSSAPAQEGCRFKTNLLPFKCWQQSLRQSACSEPAAADPQRPPPNSRPPLKASASLHLAPSCQQIAQASARPRLAKLSLQQPSLKHSKSLTVEASTPQSVAGPVC